MICNRFTLRFGWLCYAPVLLAALAVACLAPAAIAADSRSDSGAMTVPVNRSTLVVLPTPMAEVMVANPDIADVHAHNGMQLTVVGKKLGRTNVRIFDKDSKVLREFDVVVTHDLPAIRRALKNFLPDEIIGVEMVNTSIALTGQISNAGVADKAVRIVKDFIRSGNTLDAGGNTITQPQQQVMAQMPMPGAPQQQESQDILNLMQIISGQQVQLRVRVGEINRQALKDLGVDLSYLAGGSGSFINGFTAGSTIITNSTIVNKLTTKWDPLGKGDGTITGVLKAMESDGLFKLLAEPNLVAISGEEAEFLAGGEIPIPVVQGSANEINNTSLSIEYKPFGVAVKFTPYVLSENRIRMAVQPEVSEISTENAVLVSGFSIPSITTRRAKTTVELAPGESFMIAGLIKDQTRANIDQVPGAKELPVLGALFRSSEFQRNESELVIAVTPYLVDPLKSSDVKLPTDNFRPANQVEMFFFGALGALSGSKQGNAQALEGPIGFMVD
jgi:pilus assembly protein CpaC